MGLYWIVAAMLSHMQPALPDKDRHAIAANLVLYSGDPCLSIAIGMQESTLRNVVGPTEDYGYFQLTKPALNGTSPKDIMKNVGLQTALHLAHLDKKKVECKDLDKDYWTCYHSKTPKYRKKYKAAVTRYRRQLNEQFSKTCKRLANP